MAVTLAGTLSVNGAGDGQTVIVTNGLVDNGTIDLVNGGVLAFQGTQAVTTSAAGSIDFVPLLNASLITATSTSGTATVTIGEGVTIQGGNGIIGLASIGPFENWTFQGTIDADTSTPGQAISIQFGSFTNQGTLEETAGGSRFT